MCVTADHARIHNTRAYVHATQLEIDGQQRPVHVSGYQNSATNLATGPNCMFLNFAGSNLRLVPGPERTYHFMDDMTRGLEELVYIPRMRGGAPMSYGMKGISVESYGDYTVVLAQGPGDMLSALDRVEPNRRPARTRQLEEMLNFYMSWFPNDSFVLACFERTANPQHPIVVSYTPANPDVLTIPGLDGHDGRLPTVGERMFRDFSIAFGIDGANLPHRVHYRDQLEDTLWAPSSVAGFVDNRDDGPNGDYVVSVWDIWDGLTGPRLAEKLLQRS